MKKLLLSVFIIGLMLTGANNYSYAQVTFTNSNASLHSQSGTAGSNGSVHSGNTLVVVDIDGNGYDDIAKLDENSNLDIEYQQPDGSFTFANDVFVVSSGVNIWGAAMADVDHNGYKDFLYAGWGTGGVRIIKLNNTGTGIIGGIVSLPSGGIASQACNFMDVNNDGWEDIFVCNDTGEPKIWINDGSGNFPAEQGNAPHINFDVHPGTGTVIDIGGHTFDESGNYGSVWTDFDNDGDVDLFIIHCRQSTSTGDLRRVDVLFENNGSDVYFENAAARGLSNPGQDWTGSFGDIDNDGDFDLLMTGHASTPTERLFINDGNGNFTPNTAQTTVSFNGSSWAQQSQMVDFDNDGWIDIIITGGAQQVIHRNNGDNTFTLVNNASIGFGTPTILSFASGDLNHDGRIDLYTSYGSIYNSPGSSDDVYWRNTTSNSNHFITLNLEGVASTPGALGAKAFVYGDFGGSNVQVREVRAGESYGTMNSSQLHFGLGDETSVDSIRVYWPSGQTTAYTCTVPADQFINVVEGAPPCTLSCTGVTITSGSTAICSGDSVLLSAPTGAGYSYNWTNGETSSSIYVSAAGSYAVDVTSGSGCSATSPSVNIEVDPVESVTISALGATTICPGDQVVLTSSQSSGNTWSNSATTQNITVTSSGTYSTTYQGACQTWPSNTIDVTVLDANAPITTDDNVDYLTAGTVTASATSSATSIGLDWYSASSGGTLLGSGVNYSPGVISTTTTYYAEATHTYGGSTGNHVGSTNIAGSTFNATGLNGYLKFDVLTNCTLVSAQCSSEVAGNRLVELRDNAGTVLMSDTINFVAGTQTITLNFPLTPGTNYRLGTNSAFNTATFGFISPRLVRETTTPVFPYSIAGVIDITTGNSGTGDVNAYYYFYDWVVDVAPTEVCTSTRTPATIFVTGGVGIEDEDGYKLSVYPNPTTDFVNIELTSPVSGKGMISIFDLLGKKVYDTNLGDVNGTVVKTISTQTFAKGVYNVQLKVNDKTFTTRLIVK